MWFGVGTLFLGLHRLLPPGSHTSSLVRDGSPLIDPGSTRFTVCSRLSCGFPVRSRFDPWTSRSRDTMSDEPRWTKRCTTGGQQTGKQTEAGGVDLHKHLDFSSSNKLTGDLNKMSSNQVLLRKGKLGLLILNEYFSLVILLRSV